MNKYTPLHRRLSQDPGQEVTLSFTELDGLVSDLPASARRDRTWWGNTENPGRVQAHAWMAAGWAVEDVDLVNERVRFMRVAGEDASDRRASHG